MALKSKVELSVSLSSSKVMYIIPHSYNNGFIQGSFKQNANKDEYLYYAIAYQGKPVYSTMVLSKQDDLKAYVPIGRIVDVDFVVRENSTHLCFTIALEKQYEELFNKFEG